MNRRTAIGSMITVVAAACAVPANAAPEKGVGVFQARWQKAKDFTLKVADAMPAESYDFKPRPEMRSFGPLMQHLSTNNIFYLSRLNKGEIPDELKPPKEFDKATTIKYMTASFDFGAKILSAISEADLDKSYPGRPNAPMQTGWGLAAPRVHPHRTPPRVC